MNRLVPWLLGAIAATCVGCSLIIDSSPFLRPACSWHLYDSSGGGVDATGRCDQFLCRPAGYEEWSLNNSPGAEDAGGDFISIDGFVQSIPPAFFMPGNYNLSLVQTANFQARTMGREFVASRSGDTSVGMMGLTIDEVVPGTNVCNAYFRGRITIDLLERHGDGTLGPEQLGLTIELGR